MKKAKILLYGKVFRNHHFRSQFLVKHLLNSGYHVSLVYPEFYGKEDELPGLLGKYAVMLSLIEFFFKAAFADIIYLPPMNTRFIESALLITSLFNKKLVTEIYISIYDTYVRDQKNLKGKEIKAECTQANMMKKRDILALTKSDYVIHTARYELAYWEELFNIELDWKKVAVAPNFTAPLRKRCENKRPENEGLRICWWGTFIPLHGLNNILQAMKILQIRKVKFSCNLFGVNSPCFYEYAEKVRLNQLENCVFLRKDLNFLDGSLPNYLVENCDLALGIFGNTEKAYSAVPNKVIEALSMQIPTLTMNSPALREFFNPETDLWTCEPSPEAIAESILAIAKGTAPVVNWEQTRQKVLSTFSAERYREVVNEVLEKVLDKN